VSQRRAGILPQDIDPKITDPIVERIVGLPEEKFLAIGPVVDYPFPGKRGVFDAKPCARCGELVFTDKLRVQGDALVCIPCSGYEK
jgi:formylmethanofuran dehydrogenase subunit E